MCACRRPRFSRDLPAIAAAEFADRNKYSGQMDASALSSDERGHAAVIQAAATSGTRGLGGADIAKAEPSHRRVSGNDLRAAVLGANDGLVSNLCLVMGVAGAGQTSQAVLHDKGAALDTLAREELGIDPAEMGGNPWRAAAFSFGLFAVGAFCPVFPFFFAGGTSGTAWSLVLSVAALGVIGLATSLFSGRGPVYSATRQVLIGAMAAGVTPGAPARMSRFEG